MKARNKMKNNNLAKKKQDEKEPQENQRHSELKQKNRIFQTNLLKK